MALADQTYRVARTVIKSDSAPDKFEASYRIEQKAGDTAIPFTLDDLIAGLNNLKANQGVPGTARIGGPIEFALRWE